MGIKVVIADDQEVVRKGLASLFENADIEIVAEAKTGNEAVSKTLKHKPAVLLMDVMMSETDGLDALEKIRNKAPNVKVVMMSAHDNPTYVARSVALGAEAFLLKDTSGQDIVAAVKRAARGEAAVADTRMIEIKARLATRLDPSEDGVPLTKREYQVLRHLAYGLSNREIGRSLKISIETVKEHVQNILRKLDAADRTEAAVWAVKRGLV
ncbi:MAG TPA: response regulator transcription factor [Candidatus Anammoximicrobium sp.]|nr:response regulator transcription factor [Candidatus Anammoximicrobium sp.]